MIGPILSNIYLSRLDRYVEKVLVPHYTRGARRRSNSAYNKVSGRAKYLATIGRHEEAAALRKVRRTLPSIDPHDPEYRRLHYLRYADDFLLGFCGPRAEAEAIKRQLADFLRDTLKLELSESKTCITHARTGAARFLGYDVHVIHNDALCDQTQRRATNGSIGLRIPRDVIHETCRRYMRQGKPIYRLQLVFDSDFSIVAQYQQEFRGFVEYYRLAYNLAPQGSRLKHIMEQSLTRTLAKKHRMSVRKVYQRYRATIATPDGPRRGLEVQVPREGKAPLVTQWGGISLKRRMAVSLEDVPRKVWNARTELVTRLLADTCELCGATTDIVVHHIRHLKDLTRQGRKPKPAWVHKMAARRRKTLVVCQRCHVSIHSGRADGR